MNRRYGLPVDRGALHHYLAHVCLRGGNRAGTLKHWAFAALRGEMARVIADMWSMTRVRLAQHLSVSGPPDPHARWRNQAVPWLHRLQEPMDATRAYG